MGQAVSDFRRNVKKDLIYIHGSKCAICGYDKTPRALHFHHIDSKKKEFGVSSGGTRSFESSVEESKKCILVCANCHAEIHDELIDTELTSSFDENRCLEILSNKDTRFYCKECGKQLARGATYCKSCGCEKRRTIARPSREELKSLIRTKPFLQIGKQFGVTDSAIRKWCDSYNLPRKTSDIQKLSDGDWMKI